MAIFLNHNNHQYTANKFGNILIYEFTTRAEGPSPKIVGSLWKQHTSSSELPPEGIYGTSALIPVAQRGHVAAPRSGICNAALLCPNSMCPA